MTTVGILGGMGPQATILLMQKVLDAVPATDDAGHVPLIVHQNPAVPSRIAALIEGTGPSPLPALQAMARDLQAAGAAALAMPCNTAHVYVDGIRAACGLPFLDMLSETASALEGKGRIGILASPATRLTGVFDRYLPQPFEMPEDDGPVLDMIRAVKGGASASDIAPALTKAARRLLSRADHILIACTELSLAAPLMPEDIAWTDSLDCLVARIVALARHHPEDGSPR
ncbi:aspartate/glutamate racemase family protein [Sagittula stellata]|uniref:Aspartate racemase n=1 Tax=Sagittula stellata (strain ATCC 700073 / DSM 11524 / E-37) TaxID=388399 RepID=A3K6Y0_SAGS3|nr:amino acid racemase [Sagittula stellata]EBA07107.1 aspartate racemase [Sagittula stellata E-37]